jgi:hypothetical protein
VSNWKWFNEKDDPLIVGEDPEVISGLDAARQQTVDEDPAHKGTPIVLTSGRRSMDSEIHLNGGVQDSSHLPHPPPDGVAKGVDIAVGNDQEMGAILAGLMSAGKFRRIGLYYRENADGSKTWTHIHADKDPDLFAKTGPCVWLKKEAN